MLVRVTWSSFSRLPTPSYSGGRRSAVNLEPAVDVAWGDSSPSPAAAVQQSSPSPQGHPSETHVRPYLRAKLEA